MGSVPHSRRGDRNLLVLFGFQLPEPSLSYILAAVAPPGKLGPPAAIHPRAQSFAASFLEVIPVTTTFLLRTVRQRAAAAVPARRSVPWVLAAALLSCAHPLWAQPVETVGARALGMGGAFVAVANDSSATWWNPAGLATGPFLDMALARTVFDAADGPTPGRVTLTAFSLGTPPFGVSYHRFRLSDAPGTPPIGQAPADRQETGEGIAVRSLSVSQFGVTILQTLVDGVHIGSTVKYVRGTARLAVAPGGPADDVLDAADEVEGGESEGRFDLDVGAIAVGGGLRAGLVVRNAREPEFGAHRLPRQVRAGVAYDGEAAGLPPFVIALDADLRRYDPGWGERKVVALGAEHWMRPRRFAWRAGGRVNTAGEGGSVVTAGASVAPRAGFFVDGHVAFGSDDAERGWSVGARVSF